MPVIPYNLLRNCASLNTERNSSSPSLSSSSLIATYYLVSVSTALYTVPNEPAEILRFSKYLLLKSSYYDL